MAERLRALALVIITASLSLTRQAVVRSPFETVWEEDGFTFLRDVTTRPFAETLFLTYQGYLHLVPRILAWPARLLPTSAVPVLFAVEAASVTGLVALFVFLVTEPLISSRAARSAVAFALVLVPVGGNAGINSIANLQWPLLFAACLLAVAPDSQAPSTTAKTTLAAAAALSSPAAVVLAPFALLNAIRWRRPVLPQAVLLLGAGAQAGAYLAHYHERTIGGANKESPIVVLSRWFLLLPSAVLSNHRFATGSVLLRLFIVLGGILSAALAFFVLRSPGQRRRIMLAALFGLSGGLFFLTAYTGGLGQPRYDYVPALLLVTVALAIGGWTYQRILIAVLSGCALMSFPVGSVRASGNAWARSVDVAKKECSNGSVLEAQIPVAPQKPGRETEYVRLPCGSLK